MTVTDLCEPFDALFRLGLVHAAELRQAILGAGYAPSGVRYLMLASPVHQRVGGSSDLGMVRAGPVGA